LKTIASVQPVLSYSYKSNRPKDEDLELCFEILGFDIMIDENLKPWLLEVILFSKGKSYP
jgi:tubulin polyglutamylase TTLL6/13